MAFKSGELELLEEATKYENGVMPRDLGEKVNAILIREGLQPYDTDTFTTIPDLKVDVVTGPDPTDEEEEEASRIMMNSKQGILPTRISPERADSASTAEDYWAKGGYNEWKNGKKDVLTPEEREFLDKFIKAHYGSKEAYDQSELKE